MQSEAEVNKKKTLTVGKTYREGNLFLAKKWQYAILRAMNSASRRDLIEKAKRLFAASWQVGDIADTLGVHRKTVGKWRTDFGFDAAKENEAVSLGDILRKLQKQLAAATEEENASADKIVKIAAAIEKLTDASKMNFYLIEAFQRTQRRIEKRMREASKQEKEEWLLVLKRTAEVFEEERKKVVSNEGF